MRHQVTVPILDAGADLEEELQPVARVHAVAVAIVVDRLTGDKLRDEVRMSIARYSAVEERGDIRMIEVRQNLPFAGEAVHRRFRLRTAQTESAMNRLASEWQILAHFDHPNIATFLDRGVTGDGHPYFVTEFVAGQAIDDYCDSHRMHTRDRLELFLKVCAGVEYGHRNLMAHRNIQPRNILVTADGEPKLLDFGIAKIT